MATTSPVDSPEGEAIRFLCLKNFHQVLWLPATAQHERLRITFATTQNFDDTSLPVVLFCAPMFGSRWNAATLDHIAKTEGVRFVCFDRPGMGGSTRVPLNQRFSVWLEIVPLLLEKLDVKHVTLACHSAGTLFAMQTLYHLRHILDPESPTVVFAAPWVHNEHSNATLMNVASKIPSGVIDGWSGLNKFIMKNVVPGVSWSGGILTSVTSLFQQETIPQDSDSKALAEKFGTSEATAEQIDKLTTKYFFAEDTTAGSEEAKICLRKPGVDWGILESYPNFIKELDEREKQRLATDSTGRKLKVRVYFAESDMMIGKAGRDYFDKVWRENAGDGIDYESYDMSKTNHDSIMSDRENGVVRKFVSHAKEISQ